MKFIDLFSGCGGLSLGLLNAGFTGIFSVEKNPDAFNTLRKNLVDSSVFLKSGYKWDKNIPISPTDINKLIEERSDYLERLGLQREVDLVVGGPPCQGFSMAGRRNPKDPRNKLAYSYLKVVELVKPRFILMENVKGINMTFKGNNRASVAKQIEAKFSELGYVPISIIENSVEWGVPQKRARFVLFGIRKDEFGSFLNDYSSEELRLFGKGLSDKLSYYLKRFSSIFKQQKNLPDEVSVAEAISDLKLYNRHKNKRKTVKPSDYSSDRFKSIACRYMPEKSSLFQNLMRANIQDSEFIAGGLRMANHTEVVSERFRKILRDIDSLEMKRKYGLKRGSSIPKQYVDDELNTKKRTLAVLNKNFPSVTVTTLPDDILHYDEPRILTVRECARLQSFPDWYEFTGPYTTGGDRRKNSCPKYTQVGNAVPPLMAEGIAFFLKEGLSAFINETIEQTHNGAIAI